MKTISPSPEMIVKSIFAISDFFIQLKIYKISLNKKTADCFPQFLCQRMAFRMNRWDR
jgi:hypothetical protein